MITILAEVGHVICRFLYVKTGFVSTSSAILSRKRKETQPRQESELGDLW